MVILKKTLALILVALLSLTLLSSCDDRPTLKVFNWGQYIDESVLEDFEEKYGVRVIYDTFDTNEAMYAKLKADPGAYDVIFPSEYMAKRMIDEGLISKIDMASIPNYSKIDDKFKGHYYDPNEEYTVPYMWGTLGMVKPVMMPPAPPFASSS